MQEWKSKGQYMVRELPLLVRLQRCLCRRLDVFAPLCQPFFWERMLLFPLPFQNHRFHFNGKLRRACATTRLRGNRGRVLSTLRSAPRCLASSALRCLARSAPISSFNFTHFNSYSHKNGDVSWNLLAIYYACNIIIIIYSGIFIQTCQALCQS